MSGIELSGWLASQLTELAAIEEVKRSGAVSPAMRARARIVPVMMPPTAAGRTIEATVLQRLTPRPRLASRSERGTSASTSAVAREIIGIIMIASANAP